MDLNFYPVFQVLLVVESATNAGCFGYEIKDRLLSIQTVDVFGNVKTIPSNNIRFNYRGNDLPDDLIFLSASFRGLKSQSLKS